MAGVKRVNTKKLSRLQVHALGNAIDLYDDASLLYKGKRFSTAFFLAVIGIEEIGKVYILDDIIYNVRVNGSDLSDAQARFQWLFQHRTKQSQAHNYFRDFHWSRAKRLEFQEICSGKFDLQKQNSLYVGLEGRKLNGRILLPSNTTRILARKQLRYLYRLLFELANGTLEETVTLDGDFVEGYLTKATLNRIVRLGRRHA